MKSYALLITTVFFSLHFGFTALAETLHGVVHQISPGEFQIVLLKNQQTYRMQPQSIEIRRDILKLGEGDLLVGQGNVNNQSMSVELTSIDYVGLQQILGLWRTSNWDVFDFQNFWSLKLCENPTNQGNPFCSPRSIHYRIAPDTGSTWSIFLSENQKIAVGSLQIESNKQMSLILYDVATGKAMQKVDLSLLQPRKL